MRPPEIVLRELVVQWLDKADSDLDAVEELSVHGDRFREIIAFHCQQAVEKYLKAFLVRHQVEFPKTHDIAKLVARCANIDEHLAAHLAHASVLTPYGVDARYPGDLPEVLLGGDIEFLAIAKRVRSLVYGSLDAYLC